MELADFIDEKSRSALTEALKSAIDDWADGLEMSVHEFEVSTFVDALLSVIDEHRCAAPPDHLRQTRRAIERLQKECTEAKERQGETSGADLEKLREVIGQQAQRIVELDEQLSEKRSNGGSGPEAWRDHVKAFEDELEGARADAMDWGHNFMTLASALGVNMKDGGKIEDAHDAAKSLLALVDRLEKERRGYRDKCSVETEASTLEYAKLSAKVEELELCCADAGAKLEGVNASNESLMKQREDLEKRCDDLKSKNEKLNAECNELSKENQTLGARVVELEKQRDDFSRTVIELQDTLASLQKRHDLRKSTIAKWKAEQTRETEPGFFLIWRKGSGTNTPTYKHDTLHTAHIEAERLSKLAPGHVFVVLRGLSAVRAEVSSVWSDLQLKDEEAQYQAWDQGASEERDCSFCRHERGDGHCHKIGKQINPNDCEHYDSIPF